MCVDPKANRRRRGAIPKKERRGRGAEGGSAGNCALASGGLLRTAAGGLGLQVMNRHSK